MKLLNLYHQLIIYVFVLIFSHSCAGQIEYKSIIHFVDNKNIDSIGYESVNDGNDLSIASIFLYRNSLILADNFYGNIKIIDLNSGTIKSSARLSIYRNPWISDIIVFKSKIVVSSYLDSMYVLDLNLKPNFSIYCPIGEKFFVSMNDSTFTVFNSIKSECYHFNSEFKVDTINSCFIDIWGKASFLKSYDYVTMKNEKFIILPQSKIKLNTDFPEKLIPYEGFNLDFNGNQLVYFEIVKNKVVFHIYKYK